MNVPKGRDVPLSDRIRRLRTQRGWSQPTLAEKIGSSTMAIAHWEAGTSQPQVYYFAGLARAFEMTMDELWDG